MVAISTSEPIERLRRRVDLIVVGSVRKHRQFVLVVFEPVRLGRQMQKVCQMNGASKGAIGKTRRSCLVTTRREFPEEIADLRRSTSFGFRGRTSLVFLEGFHSYKIDYI